MSARIPVRSLKVSVVLGVLALVALGCFQDPEPEGFSRDVAGPGAQAPSPAPSLAFDPAAAPTPTTAASPTPVPPPTATPVPTSTPPPTATALPTSTPPPTATVAPSPIPTPRRFTLVATVEPAGAALIELDPPPSPDGLYVEGTVVTLRLADPLPNATFVWWDGDVSGAGPRIIMTVDRDLRARAVFTIQVEPTPTAVPAPTSTATPNPSPTSTPVPVPTASPTPGPTATPSPTPLPTATPAPGALRWQYAADHWFDAAPTLRDDTLYIGSRDGHLYALKASGGGLVWDYRADSAITGTAAVTASLVIVGTLGGTVHAIDRDTGTSAWAFATGGKIWSGAAVSDDTVFVGSENGSIYALGASLGSLNWRFETGGSVIGGPAVAGNTVYATSFDDHVYALDAVTGELRWKTELQSSSLSTPLVSDGLVYVGSWDDRLYALDASTGKLVWNFWAGDNVITSAAAADGRVIFGSDDGYVHALDAQDGSTLWTFKTDAKVRSSPLVHAGVVYVGSDDDHLYALVASSGTQLWRYATGDDVQATAAVGDGTVYFGSHDSRVYAVAVAGSALLTTPPTPTPMPEPGFAPLTPDELKAKLDFAFATTLDVERAGVEYGTAGSTVVRQSFSGEVIEIFENGYYLLTGRSPKQDGWVPRIFPSEEYLAYIDKHGGGSPFLKAALGFCCLRTDAGLEMIIRGDQPVPGAISTVAHEAGHARQAMTNPVQNKARFGSDLDALQEAEAYAFEVALTRKIGEYTRVNTSVFQDRPGIRSYIDTFREFLRVSLDVESRFHNRGLLFLWLAALHDPELSHLKVALTNGETLSPGALLELHERLIQITPAEVDAYVENLTQSVSDDLNFILATIDSRIGFQVAYSGLVDNVPELILTP